MQYLVLFLKKKSLGFEGFQFRKDLFKRDFNPKGIINFEESLRIM